MQLCAHAAANANARVRNMADDALRLRDLEQGWQRGGLCVGAEVDEAREIERRLRAAAEKP